MAASPVAVCHAITDGRPVDDGVHSGPLESNRGDPSQRSKSKGITHTYESVFSWDIRELTGNVQKRLVTNLDRARDKCEVILPVEGEFDLNKFYLQLIVVYELYMSGEYDESLKEIESIVKFMESCKYYESIKQYSGAFNHIAQATNAYIAVALNLDAENILENIKPTICLNGAEKSAICAVKANVFMEYPIQGNNIALKFADEACNLNPIESEWIIIWLKAKGRVRRYYDRLSMPDEKEIHAAEMLSTTKLETPSLIQASKIFSEVAFSHKTNSNMEESNKYFERSIELMLKAVELAQNNVIQLYSCLMVFIHYPKYLQPITVINDIIQKLSTVNNFHMNKIIGKYYLKQLMDYEKAKIYFTRAVASGDDFGSSLQLIKVECSLQTVENYDFPMTLNMLYDIFICPQKRLIILSQLLIYYIYHEKNSQQIMHYLKLFVDQDIDDFVKKRILINAYPLFKLNRFRSKQLINVLTKELNSIKKSQEWSSQEKETNIDTIKRFNRISKTCESKNRNKTETGDHKENVDNESNEKCSSEKPNNNKQNKCQENSNDQQPCSLESNNQSLDVSMESGSTSSRKKPRGKRGVKFYTWVPVHKN